MKNDTDFMLHAFKGNQPAVDYVLMVSKVADVWDNLIDKDTAVSADDVNHAFWIMAVGIPSNPFYRAHIDDLLPVTATGIINWMTANKLENAEERRAIEIAHVIRYSIADVAIMAALLCGGREWATEVGPELRMRSQRSDLNEYVSSLKMKREVSHAN